MSNITTINGGNVVKDSRAVINANFQALNKDKLESVSESLRLTDSIQVGEDEDHPVFGAGGNLVSIDTESNGNANGLKTDLFTEPHTQQYSDSDGRIPVVIVAEIPPPDAPQAIGIFYIDTSGPTVYISTGTSSSDDWTALN